MCLKHDSCYYMDEAKLVIIYFYIDIDECSRSPEICNTTLKYCNNTVGGYTCNCTTGYAIDINDTCKGNRKYPPKYYVHYIYIVILMNS